MVGKPDAPETRVGGVSGAASIERAPAREERHGGWHEPGPTLHQPWGRASAPGPGSEQSGRSSRVGVSPRARWREEHRDGRAPGWEAEGPGCQGRRDQGDEAPGNQGHSTPEVRVARTATPPTLGDHERETAVSEGRIAPRAIRHNRGGGPWRARIAARDERGTGKDRSIGRTARAGSDDDRSRGTNGTSGERRGPVAWVERAMHREEACRGWRAAMARGAMQERGSAPGERGS